MEEILDVLATRYASSEIKNIWSASGRILLERELWIAVLKAQKELGLQIEEGAIEAYEMVKNQIDLDSINNREKITHHDVKARIEEFCDLAGFEQIHIGMTSRDLTENVEEYQIYKSLQVIRTKVIAALNILKTRASENASVLISARTHNVAAQPTTLGKRLAMFGEELLNCVKPLNDLIENFTIRGIKGAVGTSLDLLTLFGGDQNKIASFEEKICSHLGIFKTQNAVGQVYPRSLDYNVCSILYALSCGPSSFAKTLRLMAGNETASEGFAKGQVGSSAMPHKMNSRSCERINGFHAILNGYLAMATALAGDQWNEGDVSCSVVRRVALPGSFFAIDGLLETFISVLTQMEIFLPVIKSENEHYLPFLSTTTILMEAVKNGAGRESAHEAIKEHAVATVKDLRNGKINQNDLIKRLAADARVGLSEEKLQSIIDNAFELTGLATKQVEIFANEVDKLVALFPEASSYKVKSIL